MKIHTCPNEDRETATDYGASWRWHAARTSLVSLRSTPNQRGRGSRRAGMHGPQRKRSVAAPSTPGRRVHQRRAGGTEACRRRRRPTCAGARGSAASACTHMPHVARHDQVLLVVEVQLAERHVRSCACHVDAEVAWARIAVRGGAAKNGLAEGVLVARVGVRDKVGPQFVTERSARLLGNALEQPTPTLLCALACHLGQFDRVGGLGTHAGNEPVPAGGGRALGSQPSRLDRESGLGGGSEDALGVDVELVLT